MNYNLAKQLRDAGFPNMGHFNEGEEVFPTLEELIEECKTYGALILIIKDGVSDAYSEVFGYTVFRGSNLTESVSLLWLALNKKDNQ